MARLRNVTSRKIKEEHPSTKKGTERQARELRHGQKMARATWLELLTGQIELWLIFGPDVFVPAGAEFQSLR